MVYTFWIDCNITYAILLSYNYLFMLSGQTFFYPLWADCLELVLGILLCAKTKLAKTRLAAYFADGTSHIENSRLENSPVFFLYLISLLIMIMKLINTWNIVFFLKALLW